MPTVQPISARLVESAVTRFNAVSVQKVGERIDLDVEGATYATWHPRLTMTGYSWDALSAGCLLGESPPASVLILGFGGGTVARQLRTFLPSARIVGVEIDAGVIDLARRHMAMDTLGIDVVIADAYRFLEETTERFDAIIDDLFLTGPSDVVRSRVPEGDTLRGLVQRLTARGVLVANLITVAGVHRAVRRATRRAFAQTFPSVRVVTPPRGLNEILVGGRNTRPQSTLKQYQAHLAERACRERLAELKVTKLRGGL